MMRGGKPPLIVTQRLPHPRRRWNREARGTQADSHAALPFYGVGRRVYRGIHATPCHGALHGALH